MNKKLIEWWSGDSFDPTSDLSPIAYWDNGADYMSSDALTWTDRIGSYTLSFSGTGFSRATGQNDKLKMVNTTSGYWTRARINAIQNISGLTIWIVGSRCVFQHYQANTARTAVYQSSGDNNFYPILANGGSTFGSVAKAAGLLAYTIMVFDGSQADNANRLKLWINGVQQTLSFTGTIPATTENATSIPAIGRTNTANQAGDTYEVGLVNRAITTAEVAKLNGFLASRYAI